MNPHAILTRRETEIAELFAWGATKKEVAARLYVSPRTVENHARNIYEKVEIHSVNQLSAWWFCKNFSIPFDLSPFLSIVFLLLLGYVEFNKDDTEMVRTKTCRVSRTRRRFEGDKTIEYA